MQANIKITYSNENYEAVTAALKVLYEIADGFDAIFEGDKKNRLRSVKGKALWKAGEYDKTA